MTITREELRSWALGEVGLEAARKMAEGGPLNAELRKMNKIEVIDWMLANDPAMLLDSYLIAQRGREVLEQKPVCGAGGSGLRDFTCTLSPGHHGVHRRGTSFWKDKS